MRERGGERDHYLAAIPSTAPTGYPRSIRRGTVIPNSITVHWEEVDCLDRNGAITGYVARALSNGREEGTASVGGDDREATISGLTPSTQYIVQVAAVNSAGTGPYSPIALYGTEGIAQGYTIQESQYGCSTHSEIAVVAISGKFLISLYPFSYCQLPKFKLRF